MDGEAHTRTPLFAIVVVGIIAASLLFLRPVGTDPAPKHDYESRDGEPFVPEVGREFSLAGKALATDAAAADEREKYAEAKDQIGIDQLRSSDRIYLGEPDCTGRALSWSWGTEEMRIESGPHKGELAYIDSNFLRP